jgi:small subunit ribosomal protein S20
MPNTKQAAKRLRQTEKRNADNRARKTQIKTYTKKFLKAVEDGNATEATEQLRATQKRLDKAAKKSTIHRNKAARRKSRLQKKLNAMQAKG